MKQLLFLALCALTAAAQQAKDPMTDQQVVNLAYAGLGADQLILVIANAEEVSFDLTLAALDGLMKAGISRDVIKAMAARMNGVALLRSAPNKISETALVAGQTAPGAPTQANQMQPAATVRIPLQPVSTRTVSAIATQQASDLLSDSAVEEAIRRGLKSNHAIGLRLNDVQTFLLSGLLCEHCAQSGYTVTIYTPEQWIELQARQARKEMLPYSVADVPRESRLPLLHVVALPSTPDYITGPALSYSSSVHRVVLSDTMRQSTIQPLDVINGEVETNSALRSATFTTATAVFALSDVSRLQAADPKGEFFVVVVGDNQNKFFKVKTKYMKHLFGTTLVTQNLP